MLVSLKEFISFSQVLNHKKHYRQLQCPRAAAAKRSDEVKETSQKNFGLRISKAFIAKSSAIIACLGFIDAGYSGDWSRIGVISKETEELLKAAAYVVVPFCLLLIIFLPFGKRANK